jgi:hypothetical protein
MKMMLFILLVTIVPPPQSPDLPQDAPDLTILSFEWGAMRQTDVAQAPELTAENSGRPVDTLGRPLDTIGRPVGRLPGGRTPIADTDPWPTQREDLSRGTVNNREANALVKYVGSKPIKAVEWEYIFFSDDNPEKELKRYKFRNKIKIAPGETKFLTKDVNDRAISRRQKVRITRLEYSDNSTWRQAESKP